uniref:LysR substrate-binding domain-containing protein n=1 Tax=Phenylobacterium glaciei TaxID=2803784 RepID=A0A974P170_9CAUL|nr:hypothetical protein JKL49_20165 [Phenylobacterium glaciei]
MAGPTAGEAARRPPDLVLDIRTSRALADLEMDEADIAIRFGSGRWPRLNARMLFEEEFFAVCSQQFVREYGLESPADLARAPLVIPDTPPWSIWFEAAGLAPVDPAHTFLVDDAELALQAAIDGLAAALVRRDWAAHDMAAGRLVSPFPVAARTGVGCYLVWRDGNARAAEIRPSATGSRRSLEPWRDPPP